jgi:lipopolysaccharide/colanic/teichoic acid biosynthesis glycosyltransferase
MIIESNYPLSVTGKVEAEGAAEPFKCRWYAKSKVVADVVTAALLLFLTWPVIALLLVLVKLTSRGSPLYSQDRLGLHGEAFTIYKIRTMLHDCERLTGPTWAKADDPRVTPLGRFLRRSHLDELPQLWNVVRGEMSLIGPRPERPKIVLKLEQTVPRYRERLAVRPGITGLAQVQLPADEDVLDVRRKVAYDLTYIRNLGLWLDLRILLATVLKVAGVPFHVTREIFGLPRVDF